ncbi:hypothetical protein [Rhodoferax antarcticus]|uniref:hypothetical protein n=1 Tax=Rhodoferax antarcticus TaxID=81479 RepID=UPI0022245A37|nr:hypothetical protein [Rhodoferax antarcticus]MCW2312060.1 hypothetical protein [Rhodoferax antarcticus]
MTPSHASQLVLVRRRLTGKFTQIPNDLVHAKALNWKSLGLLIYLLSLPPKKFNISLERLCAVKLDGEASVRSAMKQLEALGYMKIVRERATSGRYVRSRWIVSDEPVVDWAPYLENPAVEEPAKVQPVVGNQGTTNTEFVEIHKNSNTTTLPPPLAAVVPLEIADARSKEIWLWLCQKLSIDPEKTRQDCSCLDAEAAMDVLAEVYECKRQGGIKTSVPQFMSSLLRKAREGKFNLSAGISLRKEIPEILRLQRAMQKALEVVPVSTSREAPVIAMPPRERETLRQLRDDIARQGNMARMTGGRK